MAWYNWSKTASANATADSTINMAEGMAPSAVNDGIRALMARTAEYRDDITGAIVTGGTSTAYTVGSNQAFDTLAHLNGQMIAFTPHAANGATVTLNVDSLGAKPLRTAPNVELQSNVLISGTPYLATYNNSDGSFYLHNLASNTYGVPLGAGMDFWLSTAPSSAFAFPTGQAISRATYATLFSAMGTAYGIGDGSTTFNLPDKTGRVSAMKEATATRLTTASGAVDGGTLGASGGSQSLVLAANQVPSLNSTGSNSISVTGPQGHTMVADQTASSMPATGGAQSVFVGGVSGANTFAGTNTINVAYTNGSQANIKPLPPMIVCNYIIRII